MRGGLFTTTEVYEKGDTILVDGEPAEFVGANSSGQIKVRSFGGVERIVRKSSISKTFKNSMLETFIDGLPLLIMAAFIAVVMGIIWICQQAYALVMGLIG